MVQAELPGNDKPELRQAVIEAMQCPGQELCVCMKEMNSEM